MAPAAARHPRPSGHLIKSTKSFLHQRAYGRGVLVQQTHLKSSSWRRLECQILHQPVRTEGSATAQVKDLNARGGELAPFDGLRPSSSR
jgi:hypothetical protein